MMPGGKYYVGDLCYVLPEEVYSNQFLPKFIQGDDMWEGEWHLNNGVKIAVYNTAHGDGRYYDGQRRNYFVDAGLIGCIKVDDLIALGSTNVEGEGGHIIHFAHEFQTGYLEEGGVIKFGRVEIKTDPDEEEDYDY